MGIASFLTLVLIKGGLISQKNVGTATLSWGGAYKPGGLIAKGGLIYQLIRYPSVRINPSAEGT
jgi:hypothetical protein